MGLRSPQQLERAKQDKVQPNQAQVKAFQDTSVTDAATSATNAYNTAYNANYRAQKVKNRSDAIAKVSIQNQINRISKVSEAKLGSLKGDQVITEGPKIYEQTQEEYKKVKETINPDYHYLFTQEQDKADTSYDSKYLVKAYSEESERLDRLSAQNIKTKMDETANKISVIRGLGVDVSQDEGDSFESKILELDESVKDAFVAKGFDPEQRGVELSTEQVQARSKSLLQGIETYASSKRTDLLSMAQKAFDTYGNNPRYMTAGDREAAYKALNAGKDSAKGEIAYQIANAAMEEHPNSSLLEIQQDINRKTNSTDITSRANTLVGTLYNARERKKKELNVESLDEIVINLRKGDVPTAVAELRGVSDNEAFSKGVEYINQFNRGGFVTDPNAQSFLEQKFINRPEDFDSIDLNKFSLSNRDRQMWETKKQLAAKKKSDSRYGLQTGAYEERTVNKVMSVIPSLYLNERGNTMHPTEIAKNKLKVMSDYYQVIAENPNEFNPDVIERKTIERARTGLYKSTRPTVFGIEVPKSIGVGSLQIPVPFSADVITPNEDYGKNPNEVVSPQEIQKYKDLVPNKSDDEIRQAIIRSRQKTRK